MDNNSAADLYFQMLRAPDADASMKILDKIADGVQADPNEVSLIFLQAALDINGMFQREILPLNVFETDPARLYAVGIDVLSVQLGRGDPQRTQDSRSQLIKTLRDALTNRKSISPQP